MAAQHQGRNEVERRKQRLDAVFASIDGAGLSAELTSHFARYLCVLVSGFAEQSLKELVVHYCRLKSEVRIQRYVGRQVARVRNIDRERLKQLVQSFDPQWWADLEDRFPDELSAFDSVATVRNGVSHGTDAGITMATIKQYRDQIVEVVDALCARFDPRYEPRQVWIIVALAPGVGGPAAQGVPGRPFWAQGRGSGWG